MVSPVATRPSETLSSSTVPAVGAVISFSILIASITQTSAPSSTCAPFSTATLRDGALDRRHVGLGRAPSAVALAHTAGRLPHAAAGRSAAVGRQRVSDHLDVEAAPQILDRVVALYLLVLGHAVAGRAWEALRPVLILDQVAARLARGPFGRTRGAPGGRGRALNSSISYSPAPAACAGGGGAPVDVPDDQLGDHRVVQWSTPAPPRPSPRDDGCTARESLIHPGVE